MLKLNLKFLKISIIVVTLISMISIFLLTSNASSSYTISNMENDGEWSSYNNCNVVIDSNNKVEGNSSIKIDSTLAGIGQQCNFSTVNTMDLDLTNAKYIEFNVYVPNLVDTQAIMLDFMSSWGDYYYTWIGSYELMQGWNKIRRSVPEFKTIGNPKWSNIFKCWVLVQPYPGKSASINLDEIKYGDTIGDTKVMLTFDDSWKGVYENAYPIMKKENMVGTLWANRGAVVDEPSEEIMTIPEFDIMYKDNWDVGNHTVSHPDNIGPVSTENRKKEYVDNKAWIDSQGWTRGSSHVCYPNGSYDLKLIDQLKSLGFKSGRSVIYGIQPTPVEDNFRLKCIWVGKDSNMTEVCTMVDKAINTGSDLFVMFHEVAKDEVITNTNPDHVIFTPVSKFKVLIDYLKEKRDENKLSVKSISQWYNERYENIN